MEVNEFIAKYTNDLHYVDDRNGNSLLHLASYQGYNKVVEYLLANKVEVDAVNHEGCAALAYAVKKRHFDVVEMLLKAGANPNILDNIGQTPLHSLIYLETLDSDTKMRNLLLKYGADPNAKNKDGRTPLHLAAAKGLVTFSELLLDKGADPNAIDNKGMTPLHYAADNNRVPVIKSLLKEEISIEAKNFEGMTPLHHAADEAPDAVFTLIKAGANVNSIDNRGRSALHYSGNTDSTKLLLSAGADPNLQDYAGQTPLHIVTQKGFRLNVKVLLEYGSNPLILDNQDKTPLDLAIENGYTNSSIFDKKIYPSIIAMLQEKILEQEKDASPSAIGRNLSPESNQEDTINDEKIKELALKFVNHCSLSKSYTEPSTSEKIKPVPIRRSLNLR